MNFENTEWPRYIIAGLERAREPGTHLDNACICVEITKGIYDDISMG